MKSKTQGVELISFKEISDEEILANVCQHYYASSFTTGGGEETAVPVP